jgi:hypothetical protein
MDVRMMVVRAARVGMHVRVQVMRALDRARACVRLMHDAGRQGERKDERGYERGGGFHRISCIARRARLTHIL